MPIVDAQVHLWNAGTPIARHRQVSSFLKEDLLAEMDAAGVDRAIIVPPAWGGDVNDLAIDAARAHPDRFRVFGRLPVETPAPAEAFARWRDQPGMVGMRFTFNAPPHRQLLQDGALGWLWEGAARNGIALMVNAAAAAELFGPVAAAHPDLKLTVDHLGLAAEQDDHAFRNLPALLDLARYPNVSVKATALPGHSSEPYPYRNIHKYLKQVYDAFGASRVFWASDVTRLTCSYRDYIRLFAEDLDFLPPDAVAQTMGRGLCDWIGWDY